MHARLPCVLDENDDLRIAGYRVPRFVDMFGMSMMDALGKSFHLQWFRGKSEQGRQSSPVILVGSTLDYPNV
jgi:hypothetical protein